ncbi:patatin-like phospholipase family protein [Thiohalophilus sp.]|uniref:patatin-like phospholipase family protein n=1 Tax=Thiohalophilus sp. TaxID=3028392 RepID=UPI002ACE4BED|nr:patatin-like phospholipase family protein [Thiohalophilus sp.]MDZ7661050.1 patatin-like phospholipase family protein [Thiohalophilus sp.]
MTRREFLTFLAVSILSTGCGRDLKEPKIGLALGGGGARGLAHIPMLEVFDELGIRPHRIAGCSIGAVMGCLYASGLSGMQIRQVVERLTVSEDEDWLDTLFSEDIFNWFDFVEPGMGKGGLIESEALMQYLLDLIEVDDFSQLEIPLTVVATDFWSRRQVVFESGELAFAIRASIAVPGLFAPVEYQGKVLVDGGLVNPVPYDLLFDDCDVVVAIDVLGERTPDTDNGPTYFETIFNTFQIMQAAVMQEKMRNRPPDIYIKPDIQDVRVLEFYKADEIYRQSRSGRDRLQDEIRKYRVERGR